MDRIHCSRRMQVVLAIVATVAAIVLGLAIKLGNDMAGYLETSVARTAEDVVTDAARPAVAHAPRRATGPATIKVAEESGGAGDAADPRTDVAVASVH